MPSFLSDSCHILGMHPGDVEVFEHQTPIVRKISHLKYVKTHGLMVAAICLLSDQPLLGSSAVHELLMTFVVHHLAIALLVR
jgi:hypothetical protein